MGAMTYNSAQQFFFLYYFFKITIIKTSYKLMKLLTLSTLWRLQVGFRLNLCIHNAQAKKCKVPAICKNRTSNFTQGKQPKDVFDTLPHVHTNTG